MNNKQFKKGELTREAFNVIMHDLESLDLRADQKSNEYHYNLLKGNLKDIFGVKRMKEYEVIIDLGSKTFRIQAENEEEAGQKAIKQFEELPIDEKIDEYWVGECYEVEQK